jgi:hypothetical protein
MPLVSRDTHLSEPSRGRPGDRGPGARPAPAPRTPRATGSIPTARPPHQHREAPDVPSRSDLPRKNAAAAQQATTGTATAVPGMVPVPGPGRCRAAGDRDHAATTPRRRPARQPAKRTAPAARRPRPKPNTAPEDRARTPSPPTPRTPPPQPPPNRNPQPRRPHPAQDQQPGPRSPAPESTTALNQRTFGAPLDSLAHLSRARVGSTMLVRRPGARPAPAPRTPRATGSIPTARPPHQHREAPDVPSRSDLPRKNAAAARIQWVGMEHRYVMRTIELLGGEVAPLVHKALQRSDRIA